MAVFWLSSLLVGCQIIKVITAGAFINCNQWFTQDSAGSFFHQITGQRDSWPEIFMSPHKIKPSYLTQTKNQDKMATQYYSLLAAYRLWNRRKEPPPFTSGWLSNFFPEIHLTDEMHVGDKRRKRERETAWGAFSLKMKSRWLFIEGLFWIFVKLRAEKKDHGRNNTLWIDACCYWSTDDLQWRESQRFSLTIKCIILFLISELKTLIGNRP